jgi:peptidylprolyl isomerase
MLTEVSAATTIPLRASGAAVTPPGGLPTVTLGADGSPSITIPAGYQAPTALVTQPLITGSGATVGPQDTVVVQYTGWTLDSKPFDSTWTNGSPTALPLGNVIEGWAEGLTGQSVGSQVLLVIPADLAYGTTAGGSTSALADQTLIMVVDILDTIAPPAPPTLGPAVPSPTGS